MRRGIGAAVFERPRLITSMPSWTPEVSFGNSPLQNEYIDVGIVGRFNDRHISVRTFGGDNVVDDAPERHAETMSAECVNDS